MSTRTGVVLIVVLLVGSIVFLRLYRHTVSVEETRRAGRAQCGQVDEAYQDRHSSVWLTLSARVARLLPDQSDRFQHQRFVVSCPSGQTVLIVNDVTVGERAPVRIGDTVVVRGQYIWNNQGGLVHFTHHAASGGLGGWIELRGNVYSAPATTSPATIL